MKAVSTACLACHLLRDTPMKEPVWVPPPSFPPGEAAAWLLPADPAAVGEVRRACRSVLRAWGLDDTADSACLIMTELVTNAIRHGNGPIHVLLANHRSELDIEVYDTGTALPTIREDGFDAGSEGGRGLPLVVGALASSWTVTRVTPTGKIVAAVLPRGRPDDCEEGRRLRPRRGTDLPTRSVLGLLPQEWLSTDSCSAAGSSGCQRGCEAELEPLPDVAAAGEDPPLVPARPAAWRARDPQMSHKS